MPVVSILLVGPYDPSCGEYTFLSPPLGVWRLAGGLSSRSVEIEVFDPNCVEGRVENAFEEKLGERRWDAVGFSTTGMTLRYDLSLAHVARRVATETLLIAGGMEATFRPELMFELGPFDLVVLGEGENPLAEIAKRLAVRAPLRGIAGTCFLDEQGRLHRLPRTVLSRDELRTAIFRTPYRDMPYRRYWNRLEDAYQLGRLPFKAEREARLAETGAVRLVTLNYCPMGCTFCSSTNFLHAAQDATASIARLDADECLTMIKEIVNAFPDVRTVIFQDDIFVFKRDERIAPLCEKIRHAKRAGDLPHSLEFISTNRIDAMNPERLQMMREAGFRVLGFGVENFSVSVLKEFNKHKIHRHIEPVLSAAIALGLTPFLDMILASPRSSPRDLGITIREAFRWLRAGCEIGMYPYVIPFSGAAMAQDPANVPHTVSATHRVPGTDIAWSQPIKILPREPTVRRVVLRMEQRFEDALETLKDYTTHVPSRVRSLLWIWCGFAEMPELTSSATTGEDVLASLQNGLPQLTASAAQDLRRRLESATKLWPRKAAC